MADERAEEHGEDTTADAVEPPAGDAADTCDATEDPAAEDTVDTSVAAQDPAGTSSTAEDTASRDADDPADTPSDAEDTASASRDAESSDAAEDTEPAPVRRRRTSKLLVVARVVAGLVSVAALAAMSFVYLRVDELDQSKNTTDAVDEAQTVPNAPEAPADDDGANDILVAGNDSRTDMQGRPLSAKILRLLRTEATETTNTDTLILLRIPHDGTKPSAISIPRDTSVFVAERNREEKVNGVYGITKDAVMRRMSGEPDRARVQRESDDAGRASLIQAVQGLTGVRVDHYVEVSLYGFYLLTEAIDGVDVCLNHATSDPDSGALFPKGPQIVRAGDAVAFVRQRKNLPRGDLDRIVRQQVFLSSAMQKVLSGDLLTNNAKLNALEDAVSKTVIMDAGLHFLDLVNLAQTMASGNVSFVTIPVEAVGARNDRQQSIIIVDVPKVQAFVKSLLTTTPQPVGLGAPGDYGTAPAAAVAQPSIPCVD
ncbi:LCP family protein [Actinophytocola sp.]|uniref:LCP family glycopolymer transferase n=1 Tax=Actinophytocola sp. TaxID=1872138 RepID=UPI002ED07B75